MTSYKLIDASDPILVETARTVEIDEIFSERFKVLAKAMKDMCLGKAHRTDKRRMVGLAAPQIGEPLRVVAVNIAKRPRYDKPNIKIFVNPEITKYSRSLKVGMEGCFSTGKICGVVRRSLWVDVKWLDLKGKCHHERFRNFTARILQHEIDHLNGIRFPERAHEQNGELHEVDQKDFKRYRREWKSWPHKITYSEYVKLISSK